MGFFLAAGSSGFGIRQTLSRHLELKPATLASKARDLGFVPKLGFHQGAAGFNPREASRRLKSAAPWVFPDRAYKSRAFDEKRGDRPMIVL